MASAEKRGVAENEKQKKTQKKEKWEPILMTWMLKNLPKLQVQKVPIE